MATMYYLLFGILSVFILLLGGFGDYALVNKMVGDRSLEFRPENLVQQATQEQSTNLRQRIVDIAVQEIDVQEATGYNDGARVEEYLVYTGLGKGHAWCAAFVSWCYSQAGLTAPRNAWSPALFPMVRRYKKEQVEQDAVREADLFAIYNPRLGRINHVGIARKRGGNWLLTVEGNVNNRVLSKRRHLATIHAFSNWLD